MTDLHFLDLNIYVLLFVYPYNSMLDCISLHSQTVHQSEGWWFGPGSLQQSLLHHLQCAHKSILSFWSTTQKPHPNVLCWPAGCSELRLDICCSLEGFSQPSNGNHWATTVGSIFYYSKSSHITFTSNQWAFNWASPMLQRSFSDSEISPANSICSLRSPLAVLHNIICHLSQAEQIPTPCCPCIN